MKRVRLAAFHNGEAFVPEQTGTILSGPDNGVYLVELDPTPEQEYEPPDDRLIEVPADQILEEV